MFRMLLLALGLAAGPVLAQTAPTADALTPEQRRAVEQVVREYLLNNPEVLREAFGALERREADAQTAQQGETIERSADLLFRTGRHAVLGNPSGDVTIVEFFDYNCGFCKRAHADMQELLRTDPGIRWVLKEFPVLGPGSVEAAQVSAQIIGDARFPEFFNRLLPVQGQVDRTRALSVARDLGFDVQQLQAGMNATATRQVLEQSVGLATQLNLNGTPTYIIGREVVVGAVGVEQLRQRVANMRRCGRTACG